MKDWICRICKRFNDVFLADAVFWRYGRSYVSPDNGLTTKEVAGLLPRSSPYSFVHHKRVSRKRCPTSLPAIAFGDGRFPPWNSYFEDRQKLRLRLQTFAALFLKTTVPLRLRHTGGGSSKQNLRPYESR